MTEKLSIAKAINSGLRAAMENDDRVLIMGEDVGPLGGVFRVTDGLQKDFGEARVIDTPLAESGILGTAVGLAMRGFRPVVEIQFDGFVYPAYDQIATQVSRFRYRSRGAVTTPIVIRIPYGGGIGAVEHHGESPEAQFVQMPGINVVSPSNANDAYWMIQQAIKSDDPVVFFEPKRRYWDTMEVDLGKPELDLHKTRTARSGTDATLITYGPTVKTALEAAQVAAEEGTSLEVIDLRTLSPLDLDPVFTSVRRTGHAIVVHEAQRTLGVGAEIAARISEECFYSLESPVQRVTGYDMPYPPSRAEEDFLPDLDRILDAVDRAMVDFA